VFEWVGFNRLDAEKPAKLVKTYWFFRPQKDNK